MTATIPPIVAAKAGKAASEGVGRVLTGDIYVRRWQTVQGAGRKRRTVDHELHVNLVSSAVGLAAGGLALGFGAVALWLTQRKIETTKGKDLVLRLRLYDSITKTVHHAERYHFVTDPFAPDPYEYKRKVVDSPAWDETVVTRDAQLVVMTPRGIPLRRAAWTEVANSGLGWTTYALSTAQRAAGYVVKDSGHDVRGRDAIGSFKERAVLYHTDKRNTIGTAAREGFSLPGGLFG